MMGLALMNGDKFNYPRTDFSGSDYPVLFSAGDE